MTDTSKDLAAESDMRRIASEPLIKAYCRLVQHMRVAQEIYWQEAMRMTPSDADKINALLFARSLERAVDEETCKMLKGSE